MGLIGYCPPELIASQAIIDLSFGGLMMVAAAVSSAPSSSIKTGSEEMKSPRKKIE